MFVSKFPNISSKSEIKISNYFKDLSLLILSSIISLTISSFLTVIIGKIFLNFLNIHPFEVNRYFNFFNIHYNPEPEELIKYLFFIIIFIILTSLLYMIFKKYINLNNSRFFVVYFFMTVSIAFLIILKFIIGFTITLSEIRIFILIFILVTLSFFFWILIREKIKEKRKIFGIFVDLLISLLIFFLIIDKSLPVNNFHYSYFLGPTNQVLHGKTLLVDVSSQYGIFNIYFLVLFFKLFTISFKNFSLLTQLTMIFFYIFVYFFLKRWLKSRFFGFMGILLIITYDYASQLQFENPKIGLPNSGSFIFGIFVIIALILNTEKKYSKILALVIVSFSIFWSVFSGICITLSLFSYLLIEDFVKYKQKDISLNKMLLNFLRNVAIFILITLLFFIIIGAYTKLKSGLFPDWQLIINWLKISSKGYFMLKMPLWGNYLYIFFIYLSSISYIIFKLFSKYTSFEKKDHILVFIVTYGITTFVYYVGRSNIVNLLNISYPALIIFTFFLYEVFINLDYFKKHDNKLKSFNINKRIIFSILAILFISFISFSISLGINYYKSISFFKSKIYPFNFDNSDQDSEADIIIKKYFKSKELIPLIAWNDVEILLRNHKGNLFNIFTLSSVLSKNEADQIVGYTLSNEKPEFILVENKCKNYEKIFPEQFPRYNSAKIKPTILDTTFFSVNNKIGVHLKGYVYYEDIAKLKEFQIYSEPMISQENFLYFYNLEKSNYEDYKYSFDIIIENLNLKQNQKNIFIYFIDQNNKYSRIEIQVDPQIDHKEFSFKNLTFEEKCLQIFNYRSNIDSIVYFIDELIDNNYYPIENIKDYTVFSKSYRDIFNDY